MFATHAVSTVLKAVLDAALSCFEEDDNPCGISTIALFPPPTCNNGSVDTFVWGELETEGDDRAAHCPPGRMFLKVNIAIDVPICPTPNDSTMPPVHAMCADAIACWSTLTKMFGGLLVGRGNGFGIKGLECAAITTPSGLSPQSASPCKTRYGTTMRIEITGLNPPVDLEPTAP